MRKDEQERPAAGEPDPPDVLTLTTLEQLKVIADPLRVQLLGAFCDEPRTTKQVADSLGEKPTRLYHHVDALERVGLIRLVETRPVRGTVEKYYQTTAKRFRADPELFRGADSTDQEPLALTLQSLLDSAASELRDVIRAGCDLGDDGQGLVSYVEVRAGEAFVDGLRAKLLDLLEELARADIKQDATSPERRYRLLVAYYPLDRPADSPDE